MASVGVLVAVFASFGGGAPVEATRRDEPGTAMLAAGGVRPAAVDSARACWKSGDAEGADFSVNASFDAGGKLLAMGISDVRGPGAAGGVGQCLRQQAIALSVENPGQSVSVDVPLHLP